MSEEMALPIAKPMPIGHITYVHPPEVLPVPLPKVQTDWPGKGDGHRLIVAWTYAVATLLLLLVVSVIYGLIGAFA